MDLFKQLCCENKLDQLKERYYKNELNFNCVSMFTWCCEHNFLDAAKWIYSLGSTNLIIDNEYGFRWYVSDGIYTNLNYDEALKVSGKNPDIVVWLSSINKG